MDDPKGGGTRRGAAEELILRTIAAHADSLLRTARRHSMCADDAQDAYQRAIEIFMGHAHRLEPARAAGWLHVVVKREAQSIRRARNKMLSTDVDLDGQEADCQPTPEERLLSFDMVNRSAEALKRLKPDQLRALWLRAQGHSYSDIGAITGWSYTKVNRCLAEGRRSFLERYEGIESGDECQRWLPVLSAMVDGEATPAQVLDVRPHLRNCPGCRATLKALQDSSTPLAAVLPVPLQALDGGTEYVSNLLTRLYEGVAGGLHERAVNSFTKAHAIVEASAAGKLAAVAASAAAVAGGGYASVERTGEPRVGARPEAKAAARNSPPVRRLAWVTPARRQLAERVTQAPAATPRPRRGAFVAASVSRRAGSAPNAWPKREFHVSGSRPAFVARVRSDRSKPRSPPSRAAPEFIARRPVAAFSP